MVGGEGEGFVLPAAAWTDGVYEIPEWDKSRLALQAEDLLAAIGRLPLWAAPCLMSRRGRFAGVDSRGLRLVISHIASFAPSRDRSRLMRSPGFLDPMGCGKPGRFHVRTAELERRVRVGNACG